jgi:prefoldin subunit 5
MQAEYDSIARRREEGDQATSILERKIAALESDLQEAQENLHAEESRTKSYAQRVRQLETDLQLAQENQEEQELARQKLEKVGKLALGHPLPVYG